MTSASKAKGSRFESLIVGYLGRFFPHAHRLIAGGAKDKGDIGGLPIVLELKNHARLDLAGWWHEAEREMENAGLTKAAVVHKRKGVADPAEQWVTMPLWVFVDLLGDDIRQGRAAS